MLLGLLDVVMERTSAKGEPPSVVTTRELAEKATELYWPQADAFGDARLHRLLALVDALRIGPARERRIAERPLGADLGIARHEP